MSTESPTPSFAPFVNQTALSAISQLAESVNPTVLGGVAVGLGGASLLLIVGKYIMDKFAPGPDGKRPSFSEVASGLFTSAKKKALDVVKEVKDDIEMQVKEAVKNPGGALKVMKDPSSALKSLKGTVNKAVKNNLPASESSVVVKMVDKVLPNEVVEVPAISEVPTVSDVPAVSDLPSVPEAPVAATGVATIQIDRANLEVLQQMLQLMNTPCTVVAQPEQPPNPSV
jgi:hypothetical protein